MEPRNLIISAASQSRNRRPSSGRSASRRPTNRRYKSDFVSAGKRRNVILITLYAIAAITAVIAMCTSPLLSAHRITVRGVDKLPLEERTAITKAATLTPGANMIFAPTGRMEKALLRLPYVKGGKVRRASVNSLEAKIEVREPFLLIQNGNSVFEADVEGVPLRLSKSRKSSSLPVVTIRTSYPITPGVAMSDDAVQSAIQILKNAHYRQLAGIAKIDIDQNGNLCLNMNDGIVFFLGQAKNILAKMEKVQLIYKKSPHIAKKMLSINLSCLENPVCILRPTPPPPKPSNA